MSKYILVLFAIFAFKQIQRIGIIEEEKIIRQVSDSYLEDLEKLGVQCPEVVVAQICLETNYLTSRIYRENNNLFGMKVSSRNWEIGENLGHAKYESTAHSLADYIAWQKQRFGGRKFNSNEEYIYALGHLFKREDNTWARYATDKNYEKKLKRIISLLYGI